MATREGVGDEQFIRAWKVLEIATDLWLLLDPYLSSAEHLTTRNRNVNKQPNTGVRRSLLSRYFSSFPVSASIGPRPRSAPRHIFIRGGG